MEILIQIAQLILCLSLLVILHELGHFLAAKMFKTRVDKFYLFFVYNFHHLEQFVSIRTKLDKVGLFFD